VEDLRKAATDFENQKNGFNDVLNHFQETLLGNFDFHILQFMPIFQVDDDTLFFQPLWIKGR
jgi:hypothetical protein